MNFPKLSDKVYALEIDLNTLFENTPKRVRSKIGYTTKDMDKRISGFRFSGNLRGKEHLVKKVFVSKNILAKSIERIAVEIAILRGYEKVLDKNLGLGYSEWFYCSGNQIKSCILQAYKIVNKQIKHKEKKNGKDSETT
jgi:hypothetical protein|tara:strand:+ start:221 stop:637 length:417 start_codon:yes stop_codon:yes gene_type:complete